MLDLHHKHNVLGKVYYFRSVIFCISNRVKEEKNSKEQGLLLSHVVFCTHLEKRMLGCCLKQVFVLRQAQESSCRSFSLACQSYTCSEQTPNLQLSFILPSKQHQHSQKSSIWRWFLQRQHPSDLVGGTSSDPQLLLGLQVCP